MAISAGSERSRQKEKERRSLAHFGWSFVCALCGSIDDGDNKRADVSPRGLLCFPFSSFVGSFFFCFVSARVPFYFFILSCWTDIGVCGGGSRRRRRKML
jgi:hypothetical protein